MSFMSDEEALALYEKSRKAFKEGAKKFNEPSVGNFAFNRDLAATWDVPIPTYPRVCRHPTEMDYSDDYTPCYEDANGKLKSKVYKKMAFKAAIGSPRATFWTEKIAVARKAVIASDWATLESILRVDSESFDAKAPVSIVAAALLSEGPGPIYITRKVANLLAELASGDARRMTPRRNREEIQNALQAGRCLRLLLTDEIGLCPGMPKLAVQYAFRAFLLDVQLIVFLATMHQKHYYIGDWFPDSKEEQIAEEAELAGLNPEAIQMRKEWLRNFSQPPSTIPLSDLDLSAETMLKRMTDLRRLYHLDFDGCRDIFYCEVLAAPLGGAPKEMIVLSGLMTSLIGLLPNIYGAQWPEWLAGAIPTSAECKANPVKELQVELILLKYYFGLTLTAQDHGILGHPFRKTFGATATKEEGLTE